MSTQINDTDDAFQKAQDSSRTNLTIQDENDGSFVRDASNKSLVSTDSKVQRRGSAKQTNKSRAGQSSKQNKSAENDHILFKYI